MDKRSFTPISNTPPTFFFSRIKFFGRMILDLQMLTIYRDMRQQIPLLTGKVLDVGCGQSPYKFMLNKDTTTYDGIDIADAHKFNYYNTEVTYFDGKNIPFDNEIFDGIICTEVIEHVYEYEYLINEIYRVMKHGATAIISVPWSARGHYLPNDYFRYTPSTLEKLFGSFTNVQIKARGTDISAIANKIIVLLVRNVFVSVGESYILFIARLFMALLCVLFLPLVILVVLWAHLALWFNWGANDDPLGYTIVAKK